MNSSGTFRSLLRDQSTMSKPSRRLKSPALFICDLQEKFKPAIYEFDKVLATTQKMLKASQILDIPVFATTQNRARLGDTCLELNLDSFGGVATKVHADKSRFSMCIPDVLEALKALPGRNHECVVVGIESHICVTQTTLDLLADGHKVYVLADAVSSCNKEEVPIALARLAREGAVVTTSESWIYECMGDAGVEE
ncbi:Isochorismatase hydrolase [Patellaria atrata CBS 101060]|uniref:Isochorismatase hydrolase n=1 Tax=Patellaria atrata CBS 101060 TaxID=1346257 RepID=A0A9P4S7Z3_9PEZI|nr:Isochorismatase hydrolase [Patellaria atrata CBS 101060]